MEMLTGRPLVPGKADGTVLVAREPLSFWGGLDPHTGEVIDRRHDLSGQIVTGRVLVLPYSRGSSSTSSTLTEAIRAGTAPAAIITCGSDPVLALGSIVALELYQRTVPIIALDEAHYQRLKTGDRVVVHLNGKIEKVPQGN